MANVTKGYIGRIKNSGAQVVEAPNSGKGKKGDSKIKKGNDLRTGGK